MCAKTDGAFVCSSKNDFVSFSISKTLLFYNRIKKFLVNGFLFRLRFRCRINRNFNFLFILFLLSKLDKIVILHRIDSPWSFFFFIKAYLLNINFISWLRNDLVWMYSSMTFFFFKWLTFYWNYIFNILQWYFFLVPITLINWLFRTNYITIRYRHISILYSQIHRQKVLTTLVQLNSVILFITINIANQIQHFFTDHFSVKQILWFFVLFHS